MPEVKLPRADPALLRLAETLGGMAGIERLIAQFFPSYRQVLILPLSQGISGASVFRVQAYGSDCRDAPSVIKIGPAFELQIEAERWEAFVRRKLRYRPDLFAAPTFNEGPLSALVYMLVGEETIGDRFKKLAGDKQFDEADALLQELFDNIRIWHSDRRMDPRDAVQDYGLDEPSFDRFENVCNQLTWPKGLPSPGPETLLPLLRLLWAKGRTPLYEDVPSCICHGDLHTNNVLVGAHGELVPIDFRNTGPGHFLRDFTKLEADLMFRVFGPTKSSDTSALTAHLELIHNVYSRPTFGITPADGRWPAFTAAAHLLVGRLRTIAGYMMDDQDRDVRWFLFGVMRHALRMAERPDNGLCDAQRHLAAQAVLSLAQHVLPTLETRLDAQRSRGAVMGASRDVRDSRLEPFTDVSEGIEKIRMAVRLAEFETFPSPPVDLVNAGYAVLQTRISPGPFKLGLPAASTRVSILRTILDRDLQLTPGSGHYKQREDELVTDRLGQRNITAGESRFAVEDIIPSDVAMQHMCAINSFRGNNALHERGRRQAAGDYLRTGTFCDAAYNRFDWNGTNYFLKGLQWQPRDAGQSVVLDLRESDYYTYRTIANCSAEILNECGLKAKLHDDLLGYWSDGCEELIHGGFGILVIVHCRGTNDIVIRRRSRRGASYQDGGKWSVTANEGLSPFLDAESGQLKPALEWVKRALRDELLGDALELKVRKERDQNRPQVSSTVPLVSCFLTGALVYLPNLSVNLAFLVSLDCRSDALLRQVPLSKEGRNEFNEARCVPFSVAALSDFLEHTSPSRDWDEGALAAVGMALPLVGKVAL